MLKIDELVTTKQVAALLKVNRSAIIRMIQTGKLSPVAKLPGNTGAYLFDPGTIQPKDK